MDVRANTEGGETLRVVWREEQQEELLSSQGLTAFGQIIPLGRGWIWTTVPPSSFVFIDDS